jgi:hypothetical protein
VAHGARLYLRDEGVEHVVVNLFYSERNRVLAQSAVIISSRQIDHSLDLMFALHYRPNL